MLDRISTEAQDLPDGPGAPAGGCRSAASSESSISSFISLGLSSSVSVTPRSTFGGLSHSGPHPSVSATPDPGTRDSQSVSYDLDPSDVRSCSGSIGARSDAITKSTRAWWDVFGDDYDKIEPSERGSESEPSGRNSRALSAAAPAPPAAGGGVEPPYARLDGSVVGGATAAPDAPAPAAALERLPPGGFCRCLACFAKTQ